MVSDGLLIRWNVRNVGEDAPLGSMHVNSLSQVKRIATHKRSAVESDSESDGDDGNAAGGGGSLPHLVVTKESPLDAKLCLLANTKEVHRMEDATKLRRIDVQLAGSPSGRIRMQCACFDLDGTCKDGKVALVYNKGVQNPSVWFQDPSCNWWFIAASFTDYLRLMIAHLGLPRWHFAFSKAGLDPIAEQWFRFFSPERLSIDMKHREKE